MAGLAFIGTWGAIALHAYRRAALRRAVFDQSGPDGGAADLLWLAPVVIVGLTVLWSVGGTLARSDATLTRYVRDWRAGDAADAATIVATPPTTNELAAAWGRQLVRLRNELVRLAAVGNEGEGIDPDQPFDSIRFVDREEGGGGAAGGSAGDRRVEVEIVRRETIRDSFFGLFPTTSQVLIPVSDLGWIELRRVARPTGRAAVPDDPVWLVEAMDLLGESLGD